MNKPQKLLPAAHLWLLLPFFIAVGGFAFTYWLQFSSAPFRQHVHGISATAWFLLLMVQPYLYQKSNLRLHRKVGMFGLALAGAVVASALLALPFNLTSPHLPTDIANGLIFLDLVVVAGFVISVFLSIKNVKNTAVHGRWMISTAFWALQPALLRLINIPMIIATDGNPPLDFTEVTHLTHGLIFLVAATLMLMDFRKEKTIYASYAMICVAMILMSACFTYMMEASWWANFLAVLLKG